MKLTMSKKNTRPKRSILAQVETRMRIATLRPLVEVIGAMFAPHLEVVLHDLQYPRHSIVAIANGHVTGRKVGDSIVGGPFNDKGFKLLHEPGKETRALVNYATRTRDGRQLKSATIVYYSRLTGYPNVALCLNLDLTNFQLMDSTLDALLRNNADGDPGQLPEKPRMPPLDINLTIDSIIDHVVRTAGGGRPVALMDKRAKADVVASLDETGVFLIRGSVQRVARALGVSRFTIYNYLNEIRRRPQRN